MKVTTQAVSCQKDFPLNRLSLSAVLEKCQLITDVLFILFRETFTKAKARLKLYKKINKPIKKTPQTKKKPNQLQCQRLSV